MATSDLEPAAGVENAPLGVFINLTEPGIAHARGGNPTPLPVKVSTEGIPRLLDPASARELARLLERSADACEHANETLLPPLAEFCRLYSIHQEASA